jgi:hypothetical protein
MYPLWTADSSVGIDDRARRCHEDTPVVKEYPYICGGRSVGVERPAETEGAMDDIPYKIGDKVRVLPAYFEQFTMSPLRSVDILVVSEPGENRHPGEVPIAMSGDTWYVPQEYVEAAGWSS